MSGYPRLTPSDMEEKWFPNVSHGESRVLANLEDEDIEALEDVLDNADGFAVHETVYGIDKPSSNNGDEEEYGDMEEEEEEIYSNAEGSPSA